MTCNLQWLWNGALPDNFTGENNWALKTNQVEEKLSWCDALIIEPSVEPK